MSAVFGVIGGIVSGIVFLGAVVVYFRGSSDKGTIQTLSDSNKALRERVEILESEGKELKGRVTSLERENIHLRSQRPSAAAIADLQTLVENTSASLASRLERHDGDVKKLMRAKP